MAYLDGNPSGNWQKSTSSISGGNSFGIACSSCAQVHIGPHLTARIELGRFTYVLSSHESAKLASSFHKVKYELPWRRSFTNLSPTLNDSQRA